MSMSRKAKPSRSPEALERAVFLLAKGLSKDRANMKAKVSQLARDYFEQSEAEKDASRPQQVRRKISQISSNVQRLSGSLESIDPFTDSELLNAGTGFPYFAELESDDPLLAAAFNDLWRDERAEANNWVLKLRALNEVIAITLKNLDKRFPRKGGNRNLLKNPGGSAKLNLVISGRKVFEEFRPGKAVGTDGGDFDLFLKAVFELATGKEGEVHAKLGTLLKKVSKYGRALSEAENEVFALETEQLKILQVRGPISKKMKIRLEQISRRFSELSALRAKLSAVLEKSD